MEKIRNKTGQIISYREKVYVGGKAVTKTFKRKSDASAWKQNFGAEIRRKEALGIAHIESIDFESFAKLWLEMKEGQRMARKTMLNYRSVIKNYLLPILNKMKLENIHLGLAQKVIQRSRDRGIGAERTNKNLIVFSQMLNDAIKLNYLAHNPLAGMKKVKVPPRSLTYWTPEQVKKFLVANKDDLCFPVYALALNTGMRRGELLGLRWDKVDLVKKRIEIARVRDECETKDTTKTGVIRYLPLNDAASEILANLAQNKRHETFVFASKRGSLLHAPKVTSSYFPKAVKKAEVPKIRFHDLRTTYASNFVMAGGDIFVLSKLLGHASVEMTAKKYAALHPRFMKEAVQTMQFQV